MTGLHLAYWIGCGIGIVLFGGGLGAAEMVRRRGSGSALSRYVTPLMLSGAAIVLIAALLGFVFL